MCFGSQAFVVFSAKGWFSEKGRKWDWLYLSINAEQVAGVSHYLRSLEPGDLEEATKAALKAKDIQRGSGTFTRG